MPLQEIFIELPNDTYHVFLQHWKQTSSIFAEITSVTVQQGRGISGPGRYPK